MLINVSLCLAVTLSLITVQPYAALSHPPSSDARQGVRHHERPVPGSYVVVLKDEVEAGHVPAIAARLAGEHGGRPEAIYRHALKGFATRLSARGAEALARHPAVEYVEEDGVVELAATQQNAPWGLDRIDQRDLPLSTTYTYANSGAGVNAYVIDSGIRTTHQEFGGRASVAFDNVGDGQNGEDCHGHGTQVAGVVGGQTFGVAKNVSLHSVRIFNCSNAGSSTTKLIQAIDFVTANHQSPAVTVLSVSTGASTALDTAVRNSIAAGVTYAIAAGNNNINAGTRSPARVAEAITVGATDAMDVRYSQSNYGAAVDLFAPGVDVPTANWFSDAATILQTGTSMAAAHAAGVAARYLSGNPQETPEEVSQALTGNATQGAVINPGLNSPNLLLNRPHSKLAFSRDVSGSGELFVMNPDGTDQTNISSQLGPYMNYVWSPDGKKIAFESYLEGPTRIWMVNADGSNPTNLSNQPVFHPDWWRRDELYGRLYATDDAHPSWSPDGTVIAYDSYQLGNRRIFVMSTDGTGQTWRTDTTDDSNPVWSPDGAKIAFISYRDGNAEIYVMNADGTGQIRLTNNTAYDSLPLWSPDGTKIMFTSQRDGNPEIYVMNPDGTAQTRLTTNPSADFNPVWSPDGTKIAFGSQRDGNIEVYVMNANGSGQTNITNNPSEDSTQTWSPDGAKIAFVSYRDGNAEIYVMNADGSSPTRVTDDPAWDVSPVWQPL